MFSSNRGQTEKARTQESVAKLCSLSMNRRVFPCFRPSTEALLSAHDEPRTAPEFIYTVETVVKLQFCGDPKVRSNL
jgi:hypothetical protein